MSEPVPIYGDPTAQSYIITLEDGRLVRAHVEMVGAEGEHPDYVRPCWVFQMLYDGHPEMHFVPMYMSVESLDDVTPVVREWSSATTS